ncbi:MAG: precorrin-8X methylmutase [Telmatospirillum sp.]|nr:precorrin-8X methylmutase [Telmatospirillum sp.]
MEYLRDPAEIYRRSFATIGGERDLSRLAPDHAALAARVAHACGMVDVIDTLVVSPNAIAAARTALQSGAAVLCDAQMVAHGILRKRLPAGVRIECTINAPETTAHAAALGTTRSAAAVDLWDIEGAVVAIGNAPTALFRLLENIDAGGKRPAALFAFPVGFVGAEESKAELVANSRGLEFATLPGRRGGSAMAAAAINAIFGNPEAAS